MDNQEREKRSAVMERYLREQAVESIAAVVYHRARAAHGTRFSLGIFESWGRAGLARALNAWQGGLDDKALDAHLRHGIREAILERARAETEVCNALGALTPEAIAATLTPQERRLVVLYYVGDPEVGPLADFELGLILELGPRELQALMRSVRRKVLEAARVVEAQQRRRVEPAQPSAEEVDQNLRFLCRAAGQGRLRLVLGQGEERQLSESGVARRARSLQRARGSFAEN